MGVSIMNLALESLGLHASGTRNDERMRAPLSYSQRAYTPGLTHPPGELCIVYCPSRSFSVVFLPSYLCFPGELNTVYGGIKELLNREEPYK